MNHFSPFYLKALLDQSQMKALPQTIHTEQHVEYQGKALTQDYIPDQRINYQQLQKQQLLGLLQLKQIQNDEIKPQVPQKQENPPIFTPTHSSKTMTFQTIQEKLNSYFLHLKQQKKLIKIVDEFSNVQIPFLIRILANVMVYGLNAMIPYFQEQIHIILKTYRLNPLSITFSEDLYTSITQLLTSDLIEFQTPSLIRKENPCIYLQDLMICQPYIISKIFSGLHSFQMNSNGQVLPQLSLNHINQFLQRSTEDIWTMFIFKQLTKTNYLKKEQLISALEEQTDLVNKHYRSQNFVLKIMEKSAEDQKQFYSGKIFEDYLVLMTLFKAEIQQFSKKIPNIYFPEGKQETDMTDFQLKTSALSKQSNSQLLFIICQIIQMESQLLTHISEAFNKIGDSKIDFNQNKSNYYIKLIQKLKNKCVYNGEEGCECKKCQCIRRNRNSARESQKRKREALEKLGPLEDKFEQIEKKVRVLEEENELLRGLLIDVFKHPTVRQISSQFLEPLTKIISAESEDPKPEQRKYI